MPNITLNNRSITELESFAIGVGDSAFQEHVNELRSLAKTGLGQTAEQKLVLNIKNAWAKIYGPAVTLWPANLQAAFASIKAGIGLGSFNSNIISAFQNLRLEYKTTPAFEAGVFIVAQFIGRNGPMNRATTELAEQALQLQKDSQSAFIPEDAARAGLSFVSSPFALMAPICIGGLAGRAMAGAAVNIGRTLAVTEAAVKGVASLFGLFGEVAGFMTSGNAIQYVAEGFSSPSDPWNPKGFRYEESFIQETAATAAFFASLKVLGWAGQLLGSLAPATETGFAFANAVQHASSITGLAMTEKIQEAAGIAPESGEDLWTRFVRATFLYATITSVGGLARFEETRPITQVNILSAQEYIRELLAPNGLQPAMAAFSGIAFSGKEPPRLTLVPGERPSGEVARPSTGLDVPPEELADRVARDIETFRMIPPKEVSITQLLKRIGAAVRAVNKSVWKFSTIKELRRNLETLDDSIISYLHGIAYGSDVDPFLLLIDRLGLLPPQIKLGVATKLNDTARKPAEPGTVDTAAYAIGVSYNATYRAEPNDAAIKDALSKMPHEIVRLFISRVTYVVGHLKLAQRLNILDLPD